MLLRFLISMVAGEAGHAARHAGRTVLYYGIALLAAVIGVGFLIGAGYIATAARYSSFNAAIAFAIGFLVLAGLFLLIRKIAARSAARRTRERRSAETRTLGGIALIAFLPSLLSRKVGLAALLVPLAAALAHAVYRENAGDDDADPPVDGGTPPSA